MRCFALVQLDAKAAEQLAARAPAGVEPSWIHRCHLEHGHGGDHHCVDAVTDCLLEWDDVSTAPRLAWPDTGAHDVRAAAVGPVVDHGRNGAEHPTAAEAATVVPSLVEIEALDAIAEALARISDAFNVLAGERRGALSRAGSGASRVEAPKRDLGGRAH